MDDTELELEQLRKKVKSLEYIAYHDVLTGVYNRRYGMHTLNYWLSKGSHFCIVFIDVDRLKYVNDEIGHVEGDNYLVAVSNAIKNINTETIASRIGGDEFMLLIPDVNEKEGLALLDDVEEKLANHTDRLHKYTKSISYGVVEVSDMNKKTPMHKLLGLADDRMYASKKAKKAER